MKFETLYQELELSTEMIRALVTGISQDEAQVRPDENSWSILEVICHLYDEEREDFREHLDSVLHRTNEAWAPYDPQGWVTERNYNEQDFHTMQENFFAERARSLEWLRELSDADWDTTHVSSFGSISAADMFASWVAHDNLHIRQLVELRRSRIEAICHPYEIEYAGKW